MNINDFGSDTEQMMWDWKMDPKELRKKMYLWFFWVWLSSTILYYLLFFFMNWGPFKVIAWIFNYPTDYVIINTLLYTLLLFFVIQINQFKNWIRKKDKENILGFLSFINIWIFIILSTIAYRSYVWKTDVELWFLWIIFYIFSIIGLILSVKAFYKNMREVIEELLNKKEEEPEEEEEEEPYKKYDWLKTFYDVDENEFIEDDLEKFWIPQPHKVFPFLVWEINSTLLLEKKRLCTKDVYEAANASDIIVQVDYPEDFESEDDVYEAIEEEKFGFSNPYVIINNSYLAIKLKTTYLSNVNALLDIWENVLPAQKAEMLEQIPFRPKRKASEEEMNEMTKNGTRKPYRLFDWLTITKIGKDYYVVFKYNPWYKKLVIFPQLQALPEVLEEETMWFGEQAFNPQIFMGYASEWGYLKLKLNKLRHLLFWGQSGSWKSVFLNSLIYQFLYNTHPSEVKLVLIDPLKVSFWIFKKIKNLAYPVAMNLKEIINAINFLIEEQDRRYTYLETLGYEDIYEYNEDVDKGIIKMVDEYWLATKYSINWNSSKYEKIEKEDLEKLQENIDNKLKGRYYKIGEKISQIVMVYDEFNKFNWHPVYEKAKAVETLVKISEQGRKAWMVLILWTQTINADSVPTMLRNNIPTRVCLKVMSKAASRAIIWEEAENKSLGSALTWNWDMLLYNWEVFWVSMAMRGQGFYVSESSMIDLLRLNFDTYGTNNFVYKENEQDEYKWVKEFYGTELREDLILKEEEIKRNILFTKSRWLKFSEILPYLIDSFNNFFKFHRTDLLDKESLLDENKNVKIQTLNYKTKEELREIFNHLELTNKYISITKNYIDFLIDTTELSNSEKLFKMEEKLELKLTKVKENVFFNPIKEVDKTSDNYLKMLKEYKEFQLIKSFEIIKEKNLFYLRINFTPYYNLFVIFPQTQTILNKLEKELGPKITEMIKGNIYILWEGIINE